MITVVIPSFGRADRIRGVVDNVLFATHTLEKIIVVVEPEQYDEYVKALSNGDLSRVTILANQRSRNYAGAINTSIPWSSRYLFMGADDVVFTKGWDLLVLNTMRALPHIKVVGTNDELNTYVLQGTHSTHSLVDIEYANVPGGVVDGGPGTLLYEGYDHNYCDTEFIGTAKARAVFAPCLSAVVRHNHFTVGRSERDATYDKAYANIDEDARKYLARQPLWVSISR